MANFKIGQVTHYYDKVGIAIVKLSGNLNLGSSILFVCDGKEIFREIISSIQIEHKKVSFAKSGDMVGIKVGNLVKSGYQLYSVSK